MPLSAKALSRVSFGLANRSLSVAARGGPA